MSHTQNFITNCFYDGLSVENTIKRYKAFYDKEITKKSINIAQKFIKETTGKEWI